MDLFKIKKEPLLSNKIYKVFVPATVGNIGPGFDVLGLAVDGYGDTVTVEFTSDGAVEVSEVTGQSSEAVPKDPDANVTTAVIKKILEDYGKAGVGARVFFRKELAVAGGLGASSAACVAGAYAGLKFVYDENSGSLSSDSEFEDLLFRYALYGESLLGASHLDNIGPCVRGGVVICDGNSVHSVELGASLYVSLCTPRVAVKTSHARSLLPTELKTSEWTRQMAKTSVLLAGLMSGNFELIRQGLIDHYVEPKRSQLIPNFSRVREEALNAGAAGFSISGAGPTVFAVSDTLAAASQVSEAMERGFSEVPARSYVGEVSDTGVRLID